MQRLSRGSPRSKSKPRTQPGLGRDCYTCRRSLPVIISEAMSQNESEEPRAIESDGNATAIASEHESEGTKGNGSGKRHVYQPGPDPWRASPEVMADGRRRRASMDRALKRVLRADPSLRAAIALTLASQATDLANPRSVDAARLIFDRVDGKPKATVEHQGNQAQIGVMVVGPGGRPIELGDVASPRSQVAQGPTSAGAVRQVSALLGPQSPVALGPTFEPQVPAPVGSPGSSLGPTDALAARVAALEAGQARMLELLEKLVASRS
jgi:hypothetical protein